MATYLKIDGIVGDVKSKGHENWIAIETVNFRVQRSISVEPNYTEYNSGARPTISEITINKKADKSSPSFFSAACLGNAKPQAEIDFCITDDSLNPYMKYCLGGVVLNSYEVNTMDGEAIETIQLGFDRIEIKYTPYDENHQPQSPIPAGYDLRQATII